MTPEATERFIAWLREGGAELGAIRIDVRADGERAVFAAGPIEPGETVLRLPRERVLLDEPLPGGGPGLTARVLAARLRRGSPLDPWLDVLPAAFAHHPVLYGAETRALLEGTSALRDIDRTRQLFEGDHGKLASAPELAGCSWDDFFWAHCAYVTRAFFVKDERRSCRMHAPMADMMNHRHDPQCQWTYDEGTGVFLVEAVRAMDPGEEVFISYGNKCVCRFFALHGFVPDAGAADCVTLMLRAGGGEDEVGGVMASEAHLFADAASTRRALSFLRAAHGGPLSPTTNPMEPPGLAEPVSPDNERRALSSLLAHCDAALGRLDAGSDLRARAVASGAPHAALCARVSDAEAHVLAFQRDAARAALDALRGAASGV